MPELPDLLHIVARLEEALAGSVVTAQRVKEPVVLRYAVAGDLSLLVGRVLEHVERKSHSVILRFSGLDLAVNAMLAGRFRLAKPGAKDEGSMAFALALTKTGRDPVELRYLDDKKMGKAYLIASGDWRSIPAFPTGGTNVLSAEFTLERFRSLLQKRRDQVRVFLLDKKALDSIGNAYADEVLFAAGIHPKTWSRSLGPEQIEALYTAIRAVLRDAVEEVARRNEPIDVKVRDFLKVRRKDTCPKCGSRLRTAGVKGMDAYFCPTCQPATRPGFVDWTRTGR